MHPSSEIRNHTRLFPVGILLLATLIPRLFVFGAAWHTGITLETASPEDAGEYLQTGKNLFEHGVFSRDARPPYTPDSFRTPVYPIFAYLASFGGRALWLVSMCHYVLVWLSALLVFSIGTILWGRPGGWIAGILFAVEPYFVVWSGLAMSETLFTFLLLALVRIAIAAHKHPAWRSGAAAGIIFGLAALTRPILLPAVAIFLWYLWPRRTSDKKGPFRWKPLGCFIAGCLIVIAPWSIRNYARFGSWNISVVGSYNLYFYDIPLVLSRTRGIPWPHAISTLTALLGHPGQREDFFKSLVFEKQFVSIGWQFVRAMPLAFLATRLSNIAAFFLNDGYQHIGRVFHLQVPRVADRAGQLFWIIMYGFAARSFIQGTYRRAGPHLQKTGMLLIGIIGYLALATGAVASARYRVPVFPLIFLLAAGGLFVSKPQAQPH